MKITSSTSTTSTSGVMLISASEVRVWPLLLVKATVCLPGGFWANGIGSADRRSRARRNLIERIQQLTAKVVDRRGKDPDPSRELVIGNHRRNGHKQSGGGGDQRFRDAWGNR